MLFEHNIVNCKIVTATCNKQQYWDRELVDVVASNRYDLAGKKGKMVFVDFMLRQQVDRYDMTFYTIAVIAANYS